MQFLLQADANPDTNFVLIDDQIDGKKNVVSATFRDNEATYLAGVLCCKRNKNEQSRFCWW
ncbi:BMP family ABC transporter substrate-binding protein [Enterococcus faecalis]